MEFNRIYIPIMTLSLRRFPVAEMSRRSLVMGGAIR